MKAIEDEIPFAVPEGWAWCRLGEVCSFLNGFAFNSKEFKNTGIPIIRISNISYEKVNISNCVYSSELLHEDFVAKKGDLLVALSGATTGKMGVYGKEQKAYINQRVGNIRIVVNNTIIPEYRNFFLYSQSKKILTKAYGGAQPNIGGKDILEILLPLPPLAEQKRIVSVIEAIFTQIDMLETNKADLQTAVKQAKSKILDLAIHGKLVPQDPADEPASVMLERLRAEKEAKIAVGEIKRSKNDSYIYKNSTDNSYYEKFDDGTEVAIEIDSIIPEAWVWCYFSDIADVINGKNQSKVKEGAGKYPIYGSGGIIGYANDYICPENCTIIGRKGSINNPIFTEEKFWNVDTAFGLVPSSIILARYLFYFCKSFDFTSLDSSTTLPSLTKTNIQHILFPLPPLAVQQRILDKIDELFNQLDKIALNIV